MKQSVSILFTVLVFTACNVINRTYTSAQLTTSYITMDYQRILDTTATTPRYIRDTIGAERIITRRRLPEEISFKLNKTCFYSFQSNASDSGPILMQFKGKYNQNGDKMLINFTEMRSIKYNDMLHSGATIEDRKWIDLKTVEATYFFNDNKDTIWKIDFYGMKGDFYIKK